MAISDKIKAMSDKIKQEIQTGGGVSPTARDLQKAAMKAMNGGVEGWVAYMKPFSSNAAELARLVPTDGDADPERQIARAYLVSNGMCTETSTGGLGDNVDKKLDI